MADDDGITNDARLTISALEEGTTRLITVNDQAVEIYDAPTVDGAYTVTVTDTDAGALNSTPSLTAKLATYTPATSAVKTGRGEASSDNAAALPEGVEISCHL